MSSATSLIPELEDVLQHGSREKRAETLKRVTALFLAGADHFNEDHVRLFDDVLGPLIDEIEIKTRAELSHRLAPIDNAPTGVMRRLACDDDIAVAAPVLEHSPRLAEADLLAIAQTKGQAHLLAISERDSIGSPLTEVLIRRGDREVVRNVAANTGATFSEESFATLVKRAEKDGILAEKVGRRTDVPTHLFRELLVKATDVVRRRLLATAAPESQAEIRRVLERVSDEVGARNVVIRDYDGAERTVARLYRDGNLGEAALSAFADAGQYEETVACLAALCGISIDVVDRLMAGDRPDPILILGKATRFSWPTVRSVMAVKSGIRGLSPQTLDKAHSNFERLSAATAQRVVRFWQARHDAATG